MEACPVPVKHALGEDLGAGTRTLLPTYLWCFFSRSSGESVTLEPFLQGSLWIPCGNMSGTYFSLFNEGLFESPAHIAERELLRSRESFCVCEICEPAWQAVS